jgi:transaldolase
MLQVDRVEALAAIDACLPLSSDDAVVADAVQGRLLQRIMAVFAPMFTASNGRQGQVSVQGDPRRDTDADHIIGEVQRHRHLGANYLAKIPATKAGLQAMEFCITENLPLIATEVFSISQALAVAELYRTVSERCGKRPALFLTHISGIFDDCLRAQAKARGLDIAPDLLHQAGIIVAREQYRQLNARGYTGITMLGGGARGTWHFTEVVGGTMHVTINPSTCDDLVRLDPPIVDRMHASTPPAVVAELCRAFPDMATALVPGAHRVEDFEHYAPVRHFLEAFIAGWNTLLNEVAARRAAMTGSR